MTLQHFLPVELPDDSMRTKKGVPKVYKDDLAFVQRILKGDGQAWNTFVDEYSDRVWRRSWQLCYEACPYKRNGRVFCVFHALSRSGVQSVNDDRRGCDEGLEIYAFIFDYFYNRSQHTGKLKNYDGRSSLETFVGAVLHGHLRTDWIRHKRRLRVDQINHPEEIKRLSRTDQKVFEQMVMQRSTETIAREVGLSYEAAAASQERVTHALLSNGNLHLVLRNAEEAMEETGVYQMAGGAPKVLRMQQTVDRLWESIGTLIHELPEHHKILLDMVFAKELDAKTVLARCEQLGLALPVKPRTGRLTIHSIYQSVDAILKNISKQLTERFPDILTDARHWLDKSDQEGMHVAAKGVKALLKQMGIATPQNPGASLQRATA